MNKLIKTVALLCLWLCCFSLQASLYEQAELYFETLQPEEKSVAGAITAMAQDKKGLVWIGTQHGLVRFDGYHYRHFKADPTKPDSLHGHFIISLLPASDGRIWIGTRSDGVAVFDPSTEKFLNFRHDEQNSQGLSGNRVTTIIEDNEGALWFATDHGLDRLKPGETEFTHFRNNPNQPGSLHDHKVLSVLQTKDNTLWVGTFNGLSRRRAGTDIFEQILSSPDQPDSLHKQPIYRIVEAQDGALWLSVPTQGVVRVNPVTGSMIRLSTELAPPFQLQNQWVTAMVQVGADEMWLATNGGGISIVDSYTGQVIRHQRARQDVPGALAHNDLGSLMVDHSGLVWIGTWGAGIQLYNPENKAFRTLRVKPDDERGLSYSHVYNVLQRRNGEIWITTQGNGIDVFDPESGRIRYYRAEPGREGALQEAAVQGATETSDGQVWVGTLQSGLYRYQAQTRDFVHYGAEKGLKSNQIRRLQPGQNNNLWIGSFTGLYQWIATTDQVVNYYWDAGHASEFRSSILALLPNEDGSVWIGSQDGLFFVASGDRHVQKIKITAELPTLQINNVQRDNEGHLWLSTPQGLFRNQSPEGTEFESVNALLGIENKDLGANLLIDKQLRVWTATYLIDWKARQLYEWSKADGVDFGVPWDGSHQVLQDGSFAIGGTKGVLIIKPELYQPWRFQPQLVLTAQNAEGEYQLLNDGEVLELPAGTKSLTLSFAAMDYSRPELNKYSYQLQGFDTDWRTAPALQRTATYTNLDPGRYQFVVKGTNRSGEWSPHQARITLVQRPAWYQNWWFRSLMALASMAFLFGLYRLRLRQLLRNEQRLQQKVADKTRQLDLRNQELQLALEEVRKSALTDALTGLWNRRCLYEVLPADMARCQRLLQDNPERKDGHLLFFMLDIDYFKRINDDFGHQAGDLVLIQFARILRQCFRDADLLVRWGGEEFLVICRDTSINEAAELAQRLLKLVAAHPFKLNEHQAINRTCSVGVSCFPAYGVDDGGLSWEHMIGLADSALYEAKHNGRNSWRVCSIPPDLTPEQRLMVSESPERALKAGLVCLLGPESTERRIVE